MNWEVILWTSMTVAVLLLATWMVVTFVSARNMKKKTAAFSELHENMRIGMRIMFAGGICGKVVKINGDYVDVEVSKDTVITISRYSIQEEITG